MRGMVAIVQSAHRVEGLAFTAASSNSSTKSYFNKIIKNNSVTEQEGSTVLHNSKHFSHVWLQHE